MPPHPPDPSRTLHIAGVRVRFPHVPYRAQNALMHAVITAARRRVHALVESPTGTGKTLALLCATLAFQEAATEHVRESNPPLTLPAIPPAPRTPAADQIQTRPSQTSPDPPPAAHRAESGPEADSNADSDSDSDFAAPKKFRDVSWQKPKPKRPPQSASRDDDNQERPANAFLFNRLISMERDRPLDAVDESPPPSQVDTPEPTQTFGKSVPRIFYATRTHKQVAHVISELRRTDYRPRICVLASRREYCIRDQVRDGPQRDEVCKGLVKAGDCQYYFQAQQLASHEELQGEAWDIEELTELGRKHGACPYYASHELYQEAQIIFCPYSFLVDPIVRGARGINLSGDLVILDEAHNIENYARESAGFGSDVADMRRACEEVNTMILTGTFAGNSGDLAVAYRRLKGPMESLMSLVDVVVASAELKRYEQGENAIFEGDDLIERLVTVDVTEEEVKRWRASYDFVINYGDGDESKRLKKISVEAPADEQGSRPSAGETPQETPHEKDAPEQSDKAQVPMQQTPGYGYGCDPNVKDDDVGLNMKNCGEDAKHHWGRARNAKKKIRRRGRRRPGSEYSDEEQKPWVAKCLAMTHALLTTLQYLFAYPDDFALVIERKTVDFVTVIKLNIYCLNAAVCFRDVSNKARSVIVTSGTLAPIASFAGELGTAFEISKSLPHIVDVQKQLFVSVVSEGPKREPFDATFLGSSKFSFQDALGQALLDFCKTIPGGLLVFFPSYRLMDQLHNRWRSSGVWEKLKEAKGSILVEPTQRGDGFDQVVKQYQVASDAENGAVLFGVCRGKLSEGVDFRDATSRAVVLVGIPFPYKGDIVVNRKRQWNDRTRKQKKSSSLQSGAEWYEMQAFRALNQALGRVVRHRFDYGAILLVDCRFRQQRVLEQLPKWTRAGVQKTDASHGTLLRGLEAFFENVQDRIAASVLS